MNNKKYIISAIGVLSFVGIANAAIFQCRTCAEGTYGDGTSVSCTKCPTGAVCPEGTGAPIYLSNYKDKILSACGEIGKEIAIDTGFSSSNFVSEMIDKQKVKINSSGDIIKKGESGYNYARAYYEISCYDFDGYYASEGYKAITDFIESKICNEEAEVKSYVTPVSSTSSELTPGIYKIEVAGAGGGGGAGNECWGNCGGGHGGAGDLQTSYIYITDNQTFNYVVGKGGEGDGFRSDGQSCKGSNDWAGNGEDSSLKIGKINLSIIAKGGHGGQAATVGGHSNCEGRGDQPNTGNGKGGYGGDYGRGKHGGHNGGNGWVKIYQIGMRKTGCPSLRPTTSSSGGGCSGGYFGGCSAGYR